MSLGRNADARGSDRMAAATAPSARGSGLFVGPDGVTCSHRFLLPEDGGHFEFLAGKYILRVFAKRVRDRAPQALHEVRLRVSDSEAERLRDPTAGLYFDWGPDQQAYHPHIDIRKTPPPLPFPFDASKEET